MKRGGNSQIIYAILICLCVLGTNESIAQSSLKDSVINMFTIDFSLGGHAPAGDMADRFGNDGFLGLSVHYKTDQNWTFGVEGGFIFGSQVKEQVVTGIRSSEGFIIDRVGGFTELLVLERGMMFTGTAGKVFPAFGPNPNSGIVIRIGAGLLQHKIRLETRNNEVPQLEGEYLKGYDRLSNGFSIHQFIGYQYLSNKRLVNLTIGVEGYQAFTQSRRDYNFDLMRKDETKRFDGLYGVKVSWSFPIYRRSSGGYYY